MESIRKQASKLREQVAKQQAVLKQLSGRFSHDYVIGDEVELQDHQQLQRLYGSTKAAKHFQRRLVRGVEGLISASSKQMEIVTKLADNCRKYGNEGQSDGTALARASIQFGTSHNTMEKERENLQRILGTEVSEPLRTMIVGAPLEDARHLFRQYEHIRREVEAQVAEVARRQMKTKEADPTADSNIKLQNAESKLSDLRSRLSAMGREATAAMVSVEAEQQQLTFQRLLKMVDAERAYHQCVSAILDELYAEMVLEKQHGQPVSQSTTETIDIRLEKQLGQPVSQPTTETIDIRLEQQHGQPVSQSTTETIDIRLPNVHKEISNEPIDLRTDTQKSASSTEPDDLKANAQMSAMSNEGCDLRIDLSKSGYFIAKVIHSFDAQTDGELSLVEGNYVVVRQVAPNGWSEGECKGKAGWFPSAYVEQRDKAPASKVVEASS